MDASQRLAISGDLPAWCATLAVVLALLSVVLLGVEMWRQKKGSAVVFATGALSVLVVLGAVLRPVRVSAKESTVGARVVVLADLSRSMALPSDGGETREHH